MRVNGIGEEGLGPLERQAARVTLHCYLRHELAARGWGVSQLAAALGVRFGVAARWVSEKPCKRVVPKPETLVRIAHTLDLDAYEVFRQAGYLPALDSPNSAFNEHPHEQEIRFLMQRFRRLVRNIPESEWAVAAVILSTQLENIQVLLDRIESIGKS